MIKMNEEIEKLLNQLEKSIKEPVLLGEDYYTGEGWEEPNFFCLDPTTNDCKTLFNYITKLQNNWNELKKIIEDEIEKTYELTTEDYREERKLIVATYKYVQYKMQELEGNNGIE